MKQLKVSLPDDLRTRLEAVSAATGRSLGEEIRARIEQSFGWEGFDAPTLMLLMQIGRLAFLLPPQTGHPWHAHAGAHEVFRQAIGLLLARARPPGDPVLDPAALPPDRPVASTDLAAMAAGLEAVVSLDRPSPQGFEQLELWLRAAASGRSSRESETPRSAPAADTTGPTRRRKPKQE
jgi:hypothetical protein